tara:strand:+ start:69 stop:911 length:843 start_codon:yes stop_codon:yes gene_type:complete
LIILNKKEDYKDHINLLKSNGETISLVPTMGNLHKGHLSLLEIAQKNSSKTVTSIFVNPLQFNKNEDFNIYPRTFEQDVLKLKKANCDILFAPMNQKEIFSNLESIHHIKAGPKGNILCGKSRPGHFDGVLKVVYSLFELSKPNIAVFGLKDYQQLFLIKQMAAKHFSTIKILSGSTIRDKNGLAFSSRNSYLDQEKKMIAPTFYEILKNGVDFLNKTKDVELSVKKIINLLENKNFVVDYVSFLTNELNKLKFEANEKKLLLSSVRLGSTKLIDNIEFI